MSTVKENILINKAYLKEYSPIPLNMNLDEVLTYAKIAELIWVVPVIGQSLYDELLEQIEDGDISEANSTLLLKIYSLEGFSIVYEALPFIWTHISEVGITLGHSDNSDSIKLSDLDYILKHLKAQVQVRQDDLKYFLKTHLESYPLFEVEDDCCKKKVNPFQQIYTPKKKNNTLK